jgi:hypothetical protein
LDKILAQHRLQLGGCISSLRRHPDKWQFCCGKHTVHKFITLLPLWSGMTFVVQLNADDWPHRLWVAQQEIHMLSINAIQSHSVFSVVSGFGKKQVCQRHLRTNHQPPVYNRPKHHVKALLGRGKKIVTESVWEVLLSLFSLRPEEGEDSVNNVLDGLVRKSNGAQDGAEQGKFFGGHLVQFGYCLNSHKCESSPILSSKGFHSLAISGNASYLSRGAAK